MLMQQCETSQEFSSVRFERFTLHPQQCLLCEDGHEVRIGSRALHILMELIKRPGELISKEELLSRVWPDTCVDEGVLRVHVASLRKLLKDRKDGARFIVTVPGRGYRFVSRLRVVRDAEVSQLASLESRQLPAAERVALQRRHSIKMAVLEEVDRQLDQILEHDVMVTHWDRGFVVYVATAKDDGHPTHARSQTVQHQESFDEGIWIQETASYQ